MYTQTQALLKRLANTYQAEREWFMAIYEWYKDAKLSKKIIEEILTPPDVSLVNVSVYEGDQQIFLTPELDGNLLECEIPAHALRTGENTLLVCLEKQSAYALPVSYAFLGQPKTGLQQRIDFTTATPESDMAFYFIGQEGASSHRGYWDVAPNGYLMFRFYVHSQAGMTFVLQLPESKRFPVSVSRSNRQNKLLEEVCDRVGKKVKKWINELIEKQKNAYDPSRREFLAQQQHDLEDYLVLHREQIAPSVKGDRSLQENMQRTTSPDHLILPEAERFAPQATTTPPPMPRRRRPNVPPEPVKATGSFVGKFFMALLLAVVSGVGYAAWENRDWIKQQTQGLGVAPNTNGDVLSAMRATSKELGWKPDVCEELPKEHAKEFLSAFAGAFGQNNPDTSVLDQGKIYMAGDQKAAGADILGLPICQKNIAVYDFGTPENAKKFYQLMVSNHLQKNGQLGMQTNTQTITLANTDEAVVLNTQTQLGISSEVAAQKGKYLYRSFDIQETTSRTEYEKRITTLAKHMQNVK